MSLILTFAKMIFGKLFSKKYIGYTIGVIVILLLLASLFLGWKMLGRLQAENQRLKDNQEALIAGFDKPSTQEVNLTPGEFRAYLDENRQMKKDLDSLNVKINRLTYLQEYQGNTYSHGSGKVTNNTYIINDKNIDSLLAYLKDSLLINITRAQLDSINDLLVQTAPFKTNGCIEGTASWTGTHPDSIYVKMQERDDMIFAGEQVKNKGWFWRDVARFFTFRWKQLGSDKWSTTINVYNKCNGDSTNIVTNKKINIVKKRNK